MLMVIHLFTADTDDEIDIKVGGSDINTIKATGFHNLDSIKFVAGTGDDYANVPRWYKLILNKLNRCI